MELNGLYSFQDLAKKNEVGNQPLVVETIRVQTRLLENGNDGGNFEAGGELYQIILSTHLRSLTISRLLYCL